jgi:hypothetical protein
MTVQISVGARGPEQYSKWTRATQVCKPRLFRVLSNLFLSISQFLDFVYAVNLHMQRHTSKGKHKPFTAALLAMRGMKRISWRYHPLSNNTDALNEFDGLVAVPRRLAIISRFNDFMETLTRGNRKRGYALWALVVLSFSSTLIAALIYLPNDLMESLGYSESWSSKSKACENPRLRVEWRTLNTHKQAAYISAVHCLMRLPSKFRKETSSYDDFIFAHSKTGTYSHYAAAFLPWHRMFIHLYEESLRNQCGYLGPFP